MQLRFATTLSAQQYVRQQAWKDAQLDNCPLHPKGGCGFASFQPNLKQTRLFIDRFFFKYSIEDLSVKYDLSIKKAYVYYEQAKKRVFDVLEALDSKKRLKRIITGKRLRNDPGACRNGKDGF